MTVLSRARAGDETAFGELVEPYRRELYVHCYRMLGSVQDADAMHSGDVPAMLELLTDDAWLTMPPAPVEYQGRAAIGDFVRRVGLLDGRRRYRLVPAGAHWQPAYGCYVCDDGDPVGHALGLLVLTMAGERVAVMTRFLDNAVLPYFALPARIPAAAAGPGAGPGSGLRR